EARHRLAAVARLERGTDEIERRRAHPVADARFTHQFPGEFLARILLARRRDVGMAEYLVGADGPAPGDDRLAEGDHRGDLPQRVVGIAELVPRIDDLDADGPRIDVGFAGPGGNARVPGAHGLGHALHDPP